ncbi:MAG: carbamoyltransferase HypF [Clostridiaceae bacterium]
MTKVSPTDGSLKHSSGGKGKNQAAIKAYLVEIDGVVQGVGFRPFIYTLAASLGIKGLVCNIGTGVAIEAEGSEEKLGRFIKLIRQKAPPLSQIRNIKVSETILKNYGDFSIGKSVRSEDSDIFIPPDMAVCDDCIKELFDRNNRRYLYPFINCTNCGPRFTIIGDTPYDRINTTMKTFEMCTFCSSQYTDPSDRRYHAEPVSCPECGPQLRLLDAQGADVNAGDPIGLAAELLSKGNIVAIKGIGGYHLACDALNDSAVHTLRVRKYRDEKPFALMADSLGTVKKYCRVGPEEESLLTGIKKPIVLLEKLDHVRLPEDIAPMNPYLGIMLPYTPVHLLLFRPHPSGTAGSTKLELLVLTSGNISSEPIFYRDSEAVEGLKGIADYFLVHNREIYTRADDSVTRIFMGNEYIIRRSRGYVPASVTVGIPSVSASKNSVSVIGVGGELKNTFCLNRKNEFYVSQHIGDLENLETYEAFERSIAHLSSMLHVKPEAVAYDLHPDYLSTRYALSSGIGIKIPVQHHHAHHTSCMAENGLEGEIIGVVFDGTGYGEDGCIWGGEFFTGGVERVDRIGHLDYVPMPGGEASVKEPWRMAASYLLSLFPDFDLRLFQAEVSQAEGISLFKGITSDSLKTISQMIAKKINCPLTSSMGRLFDAVSALTGIRNVITYEGQAAIELEFLAARGDHGSYGFEIRKAGKFFIIKTNGIFSGIISDIKNRVSKEIIAAKFHETVSEIVLAGCEEARTETGLDRVALSGGVFQNITLLDKSVRKLKKRNFRVYIHSRVPANDGGISLGQAVIAAARIRGGYWDVSGRTGKSS